MARLLSDANKKKQLFSLYTERRVMMHILYKITTDHRMASKINNMKLLCEFVERVNTLPYFTLLNCIWLEPIGYLMQATFLSHVDIECTSLSCSYKIHFSDMHLCQQNITPCPCDNNPIQGKQPLDKTIASWPQNHGAEMGFHNCVTGNTKVP